MKKNDKTKNNILRHFLLIISSSIMVFPFVWMISSSLKTNSELWKFPPKLFPEAFMWSNYTNIFEQAPFGLYIFNSFFVASIIVAIQLINSAMFAYALTQFSFKGKKSLFTIVMGTYMLPAAVTYVPSYIILSKMQLLDSYTALIISGSVNIFGIFLIRQAFLQVNKSLVEAARMDGATNWQILWKVLYPIAKPSFITFGLISFVAAYNNYLWPSIITNDKSLYLVSSGLRQFFIEGGAYGTNWAEVMAASTLTVLPLLILFIVAQKWFINGFSDTGVKG